MKWKETEEKAQGHRVKTRTQRNDAEKNPAWCRGEAEKNIKMPTTSDMYMEYHDLHDRRQHHYVHYHRRQHHYRRSCSL